MKKTIAIIATLLIILFALSKTESVQVSSEEIKQSEHIDACVSIYWGNPNHLNVDCDMEEVELYINK